VFSIYILTSAREVRIFIFAGIQNPKHPTKSELVLSVNEKSQPKNKYKKKSTHHSSYTNAN
jgi:hypothetical protein